MSQDFEKMCAEIFADMARREDAAAAKFAPYRTTAIRPEMQVMLDRIMRRVSDNGNGCWEWSGAKSAKGYGRIKFYHGGRRRLALPHRVVAYAIGKLDDVFDQKRNQCVMHTCDNPKCCNPNHLVAGTWSENMKDCARKGRTALQKKRESSG